MSSVGRSSAARATCIMRVAALLCCLASAASVRPIEVPELAVCISGAVRSFATVPVLRGLKRLVLQNPGYSSAAFAALSYDTISPQLLEYNASLSKQLSLPIAVRRALACSRVCACVRAPRSPLPTLATSLRFPNSPKSPPLC